ncbi:MAG: hypothetical protein LJE68_11450 [Rhodobacter sp.]|nr:hypothetical protein [Rhodobacter sp.]
MSHIVILNPQLVLLGCLVSAQEAGGNNNPQTQKEQEMKRFIAITAIAIAATTGAASAMTNPGGAYFSELKGAAPNVDLSQLSDRTIQQLIAALHNGDDGGSRDAHIRSILLKSQ